ncbi:MAG: polyprenyl synthetase family protein [Deltaproteobacteria bacterium]|jgi:octaprenyl-diphosphate synthase|nr:MAG: polyprenyl synthetase family protein [Deltaproteobacteria bacterium]
MPFFNQLFAVRGFLIQETKPKLLKAISAVAPGIERKIPSLQGAGDPFSYVSDELELVEDNLKRAIRSREQILTDIAAHLIYGGGKRVRPMVTLLAFLAFGGKRTKDIVDIATAIELIHTATLLHDDIIDGAEIRRGKESAYKKFGLKSTLVTGDFLFIKAFEFAGKFDETIVQWTADACALLTEGEMLQGFFNRNRAVTLDDYVEIVKRKTASLFQTGAKIGAYLAGANAPLVDETERYGLNMGIAFQMVDDILDVVGHSELLGKPTGMDLRDGNPALPIILALNESQPAVCEAFERSRPTDNQITIALDAIKAGSAIQQAKSLSKSYAEEALKSVKKLPPSLYRNGLKTLVQLIIERDF